MLSIFHLTAATPEDLRAEVVAWHRREADRAEAALKTHRRPTQATFMAAMREVNVHRSSAEFWESVIIDRPKPEGSI